MRTKCDEVADTMPLPSKRLTFDKALAIAREQIPDETAVIISTVAYSLMQRSKISTRNDRAASSTAVEGAA